MPALSLTALAFALGASATTYLGGRFALWLDNRFAWLTALTAGMVMGIALIDLFPEALALGRSGHLTGVLFFTLMLGFAANLVLDSSLHWGRATVSLRPHLGPASLTLHSLLDGMSIGLAFNVSLGAGIVIAIAVLAHDFADGVNTVRLSLARSHKNVAHAWLVADSLAPVLGALLGLAIALDRVTRSTVLAFVAGAFLYIGIRELAQLSHKGSRSFMTAPGALLGFFLIGVIAHFAG